MSFQIEMTCQEPNKTRKKRGGGVIPTEILEEEAQKTDPKSLERKKNNSTQKIVIVHNGTLESSTTLETGRGWRLRLRKN